MGYWNIKVGNTCFKPRGNKCEVRIFDSHLNKCFLDSDVNLEEIDLLYALVDKHNNDLKLINDKKIFKPNYIK